jgi:hypothetical protein
MRSSSWSAEHRLLLPMQGNDAAFEARRCCFARYANVFGGAHGTLALDEERSSPPGL